MFTIANEKQGVVDDVGFALKRFIARDLVL